MLPDEKKMLPTYMVGVLKRLGWKRDARKVIVVMLLKKRNESFSARAEFQLPQRRRPHMNSFPERWNLTQGYNRNKVKVVWYKIKSPKRCPLAWHFNCRQIDPR